MLSRNGFFPTLLPLACDIDDQHLVFNTFLFVGMLKVIKQKSPIPVFVMIRPRGGDFLYTDEEFEVMKEDIKILKEAGADGVVFGILTRFVSVLPVCVISSQTEAFLDFFLLLALL